MQQRIISIFHYVLIVGGEGKVLYFYINKDVWCVLLNLKVMCSSVWFLFQKNSCIFIFTEWAGRRNLTSVLLLAVIPAPSLKKWTWTYEIMSPCFCMFCNLIPPLITGTDFNKMHDFSPSEKSLHYCHHKLSTTEVWRHKNSFPSWTLSQLICFFVMWWMCRL